VLGYPGEPAPQDPSGLALMVALRLAAGAQGPPLTFFSTVITFGTAVELTVSELSVEAFFPADSLTADWLRRTGRAGTCPVEAWRFRSTPPSEIAKLPGPRGV
jgi:hypothetical protein